MRWKRLSVSASTTPWPAFNGQYPMGQETARPVALATITPPARPAERQAAITAEAAPLAASEALMGPEATVPAPRASLAWALLPLPLLLLVLLVLLLQLLLLLPQAQFTGRGPLRSSQTNVPSPPSQQGRRPCPSCWDCLSRRPRTACLGSSAWTIPFCTGRGSQGPVLNGSPPPLALPRSRQIR